MSDTSKSTQRAVAVPSPSPASSKRLPNRVFSVILGADEEVD
jgi:hypothetical protein